MSEETCCIVLVSDRSPDWVVLVVLGCPALDGVRDAWIGGMAHLLGWKNLILDLWVWAGVEGMD